MSFLGEDPDFDSAEVSTEMRESPCFRHCPCWDGAQRKVAKLVAAGG